MPPVTTVPTHSRALILVLALLSAFAPFATDMYLPALGHMARAYSTDTGRIEGTLSAFFLGLAIGQAIYGPLIDRFGRKPPLLIGVSLFVLATLGCLLTRDIDVLISFRVLQAMGGCAGMIIGRAIINDLYGPTESARVLSLMMMFMTIAPIMAPMVGGWMLGWAGWESIFVFIIVFGSTCGLMAWRFVPETLATTGRAPLSVGSVANAYAQLARRPAFILPAISGALGQASMFAFITGSPFIFMQRFGLSEQQFGWLFGLTAVGIAVGAQINRTGLKRVPVRTMLGRALLCNLAAAATLVLVADTLLLPLLAIPLWCLIATLGLIGSNAAATAMAASAPYSGSGSALIGVLQFGCAAGVSTLVALNQNGSAYPMTIAMLTVSSLATLTWFGTRRWHAPKP